MGLISSIRKRLWIVTVLMAMALLGFILMDMNSGKSGALFRNSNNMGTVAGKSLDYTEFQRKEGIMYQNSSVDFYGRKEYLWEQFVEEAILEKESQSNGLGVSESEMNELQFGNNLSPVVERNFRDPNTGQVNRDQLSQFKTNMDNGQLPAQAVDFWKIQEQEIKKERLYSKFNALVSKSLYQPDFMITKNLVDGNSKMELAYSIIPYTEIKDEDAPITDADIQNYLKLNPAKFTNKEESRDFVYAMINIIPTSEDTLNLKTQMEEKKLNFSNSTNDSAYIVGQLGKWDQKLYKKSELSPENAEMLFAAPKGSIVGPYYENGDIRIAKILDRKMIPDSVKSRHILYQVKTQQEAVQGKRLLDSLQTVLESGKGNFADLAKQFSQDPGSSPQGGDLGYTSLNRMVKEFNDLIFYKAVKGKYYIIGTQFGFHLVEVTDQKYINKDEGIQLGVISETIQPGDEISDRLMNEAQEIIQTHRDIESFKKAINESGKYKLEVEPQMNKSAFKITRFGEGASSTVREIAKWLYNPATELGDVSPEVYSLQDDVKKYTNRYVIGAYEKKNPKGTPSLEYVKKQAGTEILSDIKFNKIKLGIGAMPSELTGTYGTYTAKIDSAKDASVLAGYIGTFPNEQVVLAEVMKKDVGQFVGPLKGKNGVYFVKIVNKIPPKNLDPASFKRFYQHPAKGTAMGYMMEALKDKEKIKDNRAKFF
ncbi:MAG TPA: peptidylprolyl isomerase [Saprospiraceae bacterium]|nr:peptidylprolyl isomerase [Saprospiraceae bacterium]